MKQTSTMSSIKLFESKKVRSHWDAEKEAWYFSVIDVVEILTDSSNPRDYWFKMKVRVKTEDGLELSTICRQLKLKATDGRMRETDVADTETLLRLIQSIPSLPPKQRAQKSKIICALRNLLNKNLIQRLIVFKQFHRRSGCLLLVGLPFTSKESIGFFSGFGNEGFCHFY